MNGPCRLLCEVGSVEALAIQIGEEAAAQAMYDLTKAAPEEIQPSWPYVLAWGRFQLAYERASDIGDLKGMMEATQKTAELIRSVY